MKRVTNQIASCKLNITQFYAWLIAFVANGKLELTVEQNRAVDKQQPILDKYKNKIMVNTLC